MPALVALVTVVLDGGRYAPPGEAFTVATEAEAARLVEIGAAERAAVDAVTVFVKSASVGKSEHIVAAAAAMKGKRRASD
jgi:hypothetical protein